MYLQSLEIENFRSLEHVKLDGLTRFNVLLGRNNAGKSSVIGALQAVHSAVSGQPYDWDRVVTDHDPTRALRITLVATTSEVERSEFIDLVASAASNLKIRRETVLNSHVFTKFSMTFEALADRPSSLRLHSTSIVSEDGAWSEVTRIDHGTINEPSGPVYSAVEYRNAAADGDLFQRSIIKAGKTGTRIQAGNYRNFQSGNAIGFPERTIAKFIQSAFFFNPFRHSDPQMSVQEVPILSQNGSDLVRVLHTIHNNSPSRFRAIEKIVHGAIPDVGELVTPLTGDKSYVAFGSHRGDYLTSLHDMGGGVEQLLMVAVVLATTDSGHSLFLEEPESHLHPGAQRYLIERLREDGRQVFISSHSPTFVNVGGERSIYQVRKQNGLTQVAALPTADELGLALEDLGLRNSDVLLSDAVLFVEGEGDSEALVSWSKILDKDLMERNVTPRVMGGGEAQQAKVRAKALEALSERAAAIPHLFVLDRDERSENELKGLESSLGERVHVYAWRELENYLLVPRAIRVVLLSKIQDAVQREKLERTTDSDLDSLLNQAADSLYGTVLVKRVRSKLGWVGEMEVRGYIDSLAAHAADALLPRLIHERAESWLLSKFSEAAIRKVVKSERARLDKEWKKSAARRGIAPGEEILKTVFKEFGCAYSKRDAPKIARAMRREDIPREIEHLIAKATSLPSHAQAA